MTYDDDYQAGKAAGTLLDPMPTDYVQVRTLVPDDALADTLDGLTVGTDAWYDKNFEVFVMADVAARITAEQGEAK